ncbi:TLD domain-containing protein [Clostridium sp. CF011]|uniref:TLD domain-containing protein n=1 Tax=Clostridium sp. CF011 TaxID=2843318 RepID=UPI001C0E8707|nr:TLD domain-containing protein [Clostridium sp. CF011]MBU3091722.1 TLD domain-containing protein [Clostridium sp. CF011]WAG69431.1 TLD domain-containing protein [Clostridium sp. CF011]
MKKKHLLIIALIISLIFGAYNFLSLKQQEKTATESFIFSLSDAQYCFAQDYSKLNENEKNYYYIMASSNLHTALNLLNSTSYANVENSNELFNAINELNSCISENNTTNSRWKAVTEKRELIYNYLHYIVINPNDKSNCKALSRLANNLRLDIEDVLINYEGKSPNWAVGYKIDGNENSHDTYYTFKYTGIDGKLVKDVKYSIDTYNEGESGEFKNHNSKVHTGKLKLTAGLPKATDRDMLVKIEWNGKKESLILKKSK